MGTGRGEDYRRDAKRRIVREGEGGDDFWV